MARMELDRELVEQRSSVEELLHNVESNLYSYDAHRALIEKLKTMAGMDEVLQGARTTMVAVILPTEDMWVDWIDESLSSDKDPREIQEIMAMAVRSCPTVTLWRKYMSFLIDLYRKYQSDPSSDPRIEGFPYLDYDLLKAELLAGVEATTYYIPDGQKVWQVYQEFMTYCLEKSPSMLPEVREMYVQRISVPHAQIDDTFSQYSSFITAYDNANYESLMVSAQKKYSQAKASLQSCDEWESALGSDPTNLSIYADYIQWELHRPKKYFDQNMVKALYERAIMINQFTPEIWDDYILFLCDQIFTQETVDSVVTRATRACPWSGTLWAHKIRLGEVNNLDEEQMLEVKSTLDGVSSLNAKEGFEEWKIARTAWLSYLYRLNLSHDDELKSEVVDACQECIEKLNSAKSCRTLDMEQIIVEILTKLDCMDEARAAFGVFSKYQGIKAEFWIKWFQWEQVHGDYQSALNVITRAISRNYVDYPEQLTQAYVEYERLNGTAYSIQNSIIKSRHKLRAVARKRAEEESRSQSRAATEIPLGQPADDTASNSVQKRPLESAGTEENKVSRSKKHKKRSTHDREHNTVTVSNLPMEVTEDDLANFFADCGQIKSSSIHQVRGCSSVALVEFSTEEDKLAALTRDKKKLKGQQVVVASGGDATVWVTNFPPEYTEESLRSLFEPFGPVVNIRFPSLKYDSTRRFCYVQYVLPESAGQAVQHLDGKAVGEGDALVVNISDPSKHHERNDPISEKRELFVKDIDFKTVDKQQLDDLFSKYGTIELLRLPASKTKGATNKLHDGYAFIIYSTGEEAQRALELDGSKLGSRNISVSFATKQSRQNRNERRRDNNVQQENIAVARNIADTVNSAQLKAVFEKFGEVKRVDLDPSAGTARVEFASAAAAGKAALSLEGHEISGQAITFLKGTKPAPKPVTMFVPRSARAKK